MSKLTNHFVPLFWNTTKTLMIFFHDLKVVSFCAKSTSAIFQFSRCKVPSQWLHGNCLCRDISIDIHILFLASGILLFSCAICFHTKSRLASALAFHTAHLFAFLHILVCDCQNAWTNFNLLEPGLKLQKSF